MKEITHSRPTIEIDDMRAIRRALKSRMIAGGGSAAKFEERLSSYVGGTKAISTSSGRAALLLILKKLGITKDDEVILPTYVCGSVLEPIYQVGAKPVITDIGEDYCISPAEVRKNITEKTKAIIVVHMFGISAEIEKINEIAREKGIFVIEDCAQSIGGNINGQKLGSFGDVSFFSFHAIKMMTCGEGGMILVNNKSLLDKFEETKKSKDPLLSMSDLQAALGINQLGKLDKFIEKRHLLAKRYMALLKDIPFVDIPIKDVSKSIFLRFPIRIRKEFNFDLLRKKLELSGIHIRKGVDSMLHEDGDGKKYPVSDRLFKETVSLPIYPELPISYVKKVVRALAGVI